MAFKDSLRNHMVAKGMKAAALARETGLSEGVISEYLSGKKEPMGKTSIRIARALEISLDALLETDYAESGQGVPTESIIKKSPAASGPAELLRQYIINAIGREPTQEEFSKLKDFIDTYAKGLNE